MHKFYVNKFNYVKTLQLSRLRKTTYEEEFSDESADDDERDLLMPDKSPDEKENNAPILDVGLGGLELTANNIQNVDRQMYRYITF
ncbi:unnamed protein product, partial [Brenthis ino]